ncbi:hypothetical protein Tco_1031483 [Tanacetum coccineum]|uniref:Retrotransposon gag domain-containing protein n=1 Tax=Tanacetum coccineum TaxID=301880 RepID=A0ABQ5G949_9ASTR
MFQQHQDESFYDAWTRFKNLIQRVPRHGLNLWYQIQIFFNHIDRYTQIDINYAASGNLRGLSAEEAWETIEDFGNEVVRVKIPSCMSWLDAYDEPLGDLDMMENKVENQSPQSTLHVLLSFEVYTLHVTYSEEVEETLGTPMEEEPLDQTKLENVGDERGPQPPIKPHSSDSFRMKVVEPLTIHTPPSPHVASFHPKDMYCYYRPCINDPKKHYGFKPGLLGHSGSLGVDFSKSGMIKDDWKLESKKVSFLGRGFNSPVRPKEVEKVMFDEKKLGNS